MTGFERKEHKRTVTRASGTGYRQLGPWMAACNQHSQQPINRPFQVRLPVHTALLQDRSRDSRWHNRPPLRHLTIRSISEPVPSIPSLRILFHSVPLETPQRIFRKVETPSPLSADTILIKVSSFRFLTNRIRQSPMRNLLSSFVRSVDEVTEDQDGDDTKGDCYADDRILTG